MRKDWTPFVRIDRLDWKLAPSLHASCTDVYHNNQFMVFVIPESSSWGAITRLMIRRNDAAPIRCWSDLQRIKNELCGAESVAVEIFPRESELVDDANIYHLWVLPETFELPFGLVDRNG